MFKFLQRWKERRRNPKGYGYCIYAEFGPKLRIDRKSRLVGEFKSESLEEIEDWISDYTRVDEAVWCMAEAEGTAHNTSHEVISYLLRQFPWLGEEGVRHAVNRSEYFAWHEGYQTSPISNLAHLNDECDRNGKVN